MKSIFKLAILLAFSFSITTSAIAAGSKGIAIALKIKGKVTLEREGESSSLKFGTVLNHGDVVKTGKKGFVTLAFTDDKSLVKLTENTHVEIQGKRDASGNISKRVSMEIGEIFAKVKQQRGVLEIATPTSVASVKGTEFWVVVDDQGNSFVTTVEGLVELLNRIDGSVVEIRKGQRGEIDLEGNVTIIDVPPEDLIGDPDPEPEGMDVIRRTIEVDFADEEGNIRTIKIEILETVPEEDEGE